MKAFFVSSALFSWMVAGNSGSAWAQSPGQPASADPTNFIFLMVAMVAIMYFIVIRPQQKEQKQHQLRINALKKGDRVVTTGGIHGTVKLVKEKTLVVEIAQGVKVTLNRQSVTTVLEGENGKGKKSEPEEEETTGDDEDEG